MTHTKGVIDPSKRDSSEEMFIGWGPTPSVDRRFLLGALPVGIVAAGGLSWLRASQLDDPGAGAWLTNATHEVTGRLFTEPYPMIRIADPASPFGIRTVLVLAQGKCTSSLKFGSHIGAPVTAAGALIVRKDRQLLEVPPFLEKWLTPHDDVDNPNQALINPQTENLGRFQLAGTIMDTKCFFGVMRPGRGKTHKACASLCIRGGIAPSFWVRDKKGGESVLLMTDADGGPMPMDILPLVADPVEVSGKIVRVGDLLQLRADPDAFRRV